MLGQNFQKRLLAGKTSSKEEYLFIFFVSLLCMTVYIASDVFLPSLPHMTRELNTTIALAQMTVSIFMIGLASTQILHGLLADRFGKKTVLMSVLPVFIVATYFCLCSKTIEMLIACRLVQSISASACLVIGRSIFVDLFEVKKAQRAFAILVPCVSLSPAVGPAIGGILATYYDWRASFVFVLFFSLVVFAFVCFYLPETRPSEKRTSAFNLRFLGISLKQILTDSVFLKSAISLSMATTCWWYYVTGSPHMFHQLGVSQAVIGLLYFPAVLPYIIFALRARSLLKTKTPQEIFLRGNKILLFSSTIMPLVALFYHLNIFSVILATIFMTASNGLIISMAIAAGIERFKNQSGLAAGMLGTIQLFSGAFSSFLVGAAGESFNLNAFAWFVFVTTCVGCVAYGLVNMLENKRNLDGKVTV